MLQPSFQHVCPSPAHMLSGAAELLWGHSLGWLMGQAEALRGTTSAIFSFFFLFFFFFCLLRLHLQHMEVPRQGGRIRATAGSLHYSHSNARSELRLRPTPRQCWILNPWSEDGDQTRILLDTNRKSTICGAPTGPPKSATFNFKEMQIKTGLHISAPSHPFGIDGQP